MIRILDEIHLPPEQIPGLLERLDQGYRPQAERHGLTLLQRWVSPPVAVPGEHNRLWLLWQVPDVATYYSLRTAAGAEVLAFWAEVAERAVQRRRHVLVSADQTLRQRESSSHEA
ncbi:hypothetical protein BLX41_30140 [Pseudomonas protegens]|uniref:hypothetical protein n=1 Tax=Pseudomonas protegens TaxID=380021 RepID=UPI000F4CF8AB|nr:hypothetical protein [Pseudomonas protegens]ROL63694.1 hypothetical protein BLX41_30140 [Pseudomonas protegens]